MLTTQELRQLPIKDLHAELEKVSRDYMKIKMNLDGSAKESHKTQALRKQIARIKTVQKEISVEEAAKKDSKETKESAKKETKKAA